ncbi:type II toxin-antitoxin system RelE/ParE family toxin [Rhodopseudomonas boonkerdii]|uniref:type II toxin-antitoxin system RelE/ParE family toxin n=1 Tax=Rhodopseudomonas boonkerdii TaxID=475937 RepID=UPI001E4A469A|nr:type II toxin-antitoxin system RelE/ParE family toxin [Rhodopseudomonas boonkerdii]UGV25986.1 type II toxin-antitoxin system RelE/ParE family toxin [Rhodopseudomonas boonkerdii]
MARYRLSEPAKADIAAILRTSETMHGADARLRYRALLTAALRRIAVRPTVSVSVDCSDLFAGLRSYHIRHSRNHSREAPVGHPVHVIFYRTQGAGIIEVVRVLHERMLPGRHVGG